MKNQVIEIIKDIIVSILILAIIIIVLCIIFYDKIALSKAIPESENYIPSKDMQKELQNNNLDEEEMVVVNYFIDASDLKKYEKTNEYNPEKSNPFEELDSNRLDGLYTEKKSSSISNSATSNFYDDDGTK